MKIEATWSQPTKLVLSRSPDKIYELDLEALPAKPGVYVFGRRHGGSVTPIYIGETLSIKARTKGHLNSVALMGAIKAAPKGERFFIYCTVKAGNKDKAKKLIKVLEKALILHAQSEGHELVNKKGTKLPADEITFTGNRTSEAIAPRKMLVKRALTKAKAKPAPTARRR